MIKKLNRDFFIFSSKTRSTSYVVNRDHSWNPTPFTCSYPCTRTWNFSTHTFTCSFSCTRTWSFITRILPRNLSLSDSQQNTGTHAVFCSHTHSHFHSQYSHLQLHSLALEHSNSFPRRRYCISINRLILYQLLIKIYQPVNVHIKKLYLVSTGWCPYQPVDKF